ncbi:MAG: T9SS type A sorting domain-containing protein [Bacteroidales bacterium]|nr:T9SS type A sorting domain-containing protein [Bacteroidales bacterium]
MKQFKFLIFTLILLISNSAFSQLVTVGLGSNATLKRFIKEHPEKRFVKSLDTLDLPFIEDFSSLSVYPDNSKWTNNHVYVNAHFGINPPSVGVATFDVMDAFGDIYSHSSTAAFGADTLTSQPINLEYFILDNSATFSSDDLFYYNTESDTYFPADSLFYFDGTDYQNAFSNPFTFSAGEDSIFCYNTILDTLFNVTDSLYYFDGTTGYEYIHRFFIENYEASDSVYISFFIQPGGVAGDFPEYKDSLVLHFFSPDFNQWRSVWRTAGNFQVDSFIQVLVPVIDTIFLRNGFRFRFINYASLEGINATQYSNNQDFWNLDYIKIDRERSAVDTVLRDVAMQSLPNPAINGYYSMPWKHFKANGPELMADSMRITYYVNDVIGRLIDRSYNWTDVMGTYPPVLFGTYTDNAMPFQNSFNSTLQNRIYDSNSADSAIFEVQVYLTTDTTDYKQNDSVKIEHYFYNFYAYDDGSAEMGVMIEGEGSSNGKLAVKYHNYKEDTIRGMRIYFDKTYQNAFDNKYFYLTIWEDNDGVPGDTIYSRNNFRVDITDERDEFTYYLLDSAFVLPEGDFYIGYITITEDEPIMLGIDRNNNSMEKVFFRFTGNWMQSNIPGAVMLQPLFGAAFTTDIQPVRKAKKEIAIYPNPSSGIIYFKGVEENNYPLKIRVFNRLGQEVYNSFVQENFVNLEFLKAEMYIIQLIDEKGNIFVNKIFIQ